MSYLEPCITLVYSEPAIFKILAYLKPKHIHNSVKAYAGTPRTLCNASILGALPYSKLYHIQNFGIFRTWGIVCVGTFSHIQAYSIMEPEAYSESCLCRYIQAHWGIFNSGDYNNINFRFSSLILQTFQQKLERHMFFLTTMTSISMFKLSQLK